MTGLDRLMPILACPVCRARLEAGDAQLTCSACGRSYAVRDGVPRLFHPGSLFATLSSASCSDAAPGWLRTQLSGWAPQMTTWVDETIFRMLNESPKDALILNLGSGEGLFDDRIDPGLSMINFDVRAVPRANVLGDGHFLPFQDESLDAVFSNAVLEHVARPWIVAEEIRRVLKPGGRILICVPFLNIIHDTHDYFRFTDKAIEVLFPGFDKIAGGVSAGGGSFLGPFLVEYALCFVPGSLTKKLGRRVLSFVLSPLKYLDLMVRRSAHLRITADAFYFVGVKVAGP